MLQVSELSGHHDTESFDCGNAELNNYLRQIAGQHIRKSLARVYVACEESDLGRIVAYYSHEEAKRFCLKFGFLELPDRPLTLFLPIARVKGATARAKR